MPDDIAQILRRLDATERNQTDLARSVTMLTENLDDIRKTVDDLRIEGVRREERDVSIKDRFDRIEKRLDGIFKLGLWVLAAFGSSSIALIVNFAFRGGFFVR